MCKCLPTEHKTHKAKMGRPARNGTSRQAISRDVIGLNTTIDSMVITDMINNFIQQPQPHKFISSSYAAFIKVNHILGNKTYLNKFKFKYMCVNIYIIIYLLSEPNTVDPEIF